MKRKLLTTFDGETERVIELDDSVSEETRDAIIKAVLADFFKNEPPEQKNPVDKNG